MGYWSTAPASDADQQSRVWGDDPATKVEDAIQRHLAARASRPSQEQMEKLLREDAALHTQLDKVFRRDWMRPMKPEEFDAGLRFTLSIYDYL